MALINLQNGHWIDIPAEGYGIDYGWGRTVVESNISDSRVIELLRLNDNDDESQEAL